MRRVRSVEALQGRKCLPLGLLPMRGQELQMRSDVRLQLLRKVLPAGSFFCLERRLDQLLLRPAFDGAACVPGSRDRPPRLDVHRQRRRLLSVGHVGVDHRLIDRARRDTLEAAIADQPRELCPAGTDPSGGAAIVATQASAVCPARGSPCSPRNQNSARLGVRLVVRQRLPLHAAVGVMELVDLERHCAPARGDALQRPIERLGNHAQRAAPVRPLRRRQLLRLLDRRDGIGEGGFE